MAVLSYLEWDSVFFQKKIGKIDLSETEISLDETLEDLLIKAQTEKYDLVYVFFSKEKFVADRLLADFNGALVDRKIIFKGNVSIEVPKEAVAEIEEYDSHEVSASLLNLAYISGGHSRFRLDHNFGIEAFRKLYKIWIEKSVNKENADVVFVSKDSSGNLTGMVTVKLKSDCGEIGLIAVDTSVQSSGIGRRLVDRVKLYLIEHGETTLEVATQLDNLGACNFYMKCDLAEKSVTNIYHFWLNK